LWHFKLSRYVEAANVAWHDLEADHPLASLVASAEEHLHADADSEKRPVRFDKRLNGIVDSCGSKLIHGRVKRAVAGQHGLVAVSDHFRIGRDEGTGGADMMKRLFDATEIPMP
jgi:hypothetical protein